MLPAKNLAYPKLLLRFSLRVILLASAPYADGVGGGMEISPIGALQLVQNFVSADSSVPHFGQYGIFVLPLV
jgi:hypothetical protein